MHQQVWNQGGVERTWAHGDEVGLTDGGEGFGQRTAAARHDIEMLDRNPRFVDPGLAFDSTAVAQPRLQVDVGEGGRVDFAPNRKDFA